MFIIHYSLNPFPPQAKSSSIIYYLSSMPKARYSLFLALAGHDYFINHYSLNKYSFLIFNF